MRADERNRWTRHAVAGVGALALATMGAFGAMVAEPPSNGAVPAGQLGETVTKTTAPSEIKTPFAKPKLKVDLPKGYGNG